MGLLDGKRIVPSNKNSTIDISLFPQLLVERVDVVTGGASAAYGSDAVAGVVNFVLDTKFVGFKGEIGGGISTYGDLPDWRGAFAWGGAFAGDARSFGGSYFLDSFGLGFGLGGSFDGGSGGLFTGWNDQKFLPSASSMSPFLHDRMELRPMNTPEPMRMPVFVSPFASTRQLSSMTTLSPMWILCGCRRTTFCPNTTFRPHDPRSAG